VREGSESQFVIVEKEAIVTGEHVRSAYAVSRTGSDFDYQISFTLNPEGASKFGDWTGKNINNYLAVVLDDKVQSVAYIKSQISDMGEISGRFTKASAEEIALSLNSGYLPADLKIIEERAFK
jgi:preprotein translocase subunit SecD